MELSNLLSLVGGLALFLYGMQMMNDGLESAAGNRMKSILEKLTTNRFLGVVVGAVITAIIQSSSATTVMLVGFVNSGIMKLSQAVWVIMGANIGTTITGQLIALDISTIAPIFAIVGVVCVVFFKSKKLNNFGKIVAGLGVLFIGMGMMSDAMRPLRDSEFFIGLLTTVRNPFVGVLIGAVFTAIIQSSSASVGILQALAASGIIGLSDSVYVLFGMNIGTCITAVLASIGTSRSAKRVAIIHFTFKIIGTAIFMIVCELTGFTDFLVRLTPDSPVAQIANMHSIFNIVTTIILLPFGNLLVKFSTVILPEKEEEAGEMRLKYLNYEGPIKDHFIGATALVITQLFKEVERMLTIAKENVMLGFKSVEEGSLDYLSQIDENEECVDFLNREIAIYVSHVITTDMPASDAQTINALYKVVTNIERISDHAVNFSGYAKHLFDKKFSLSEIALNEVSQMREACIDGLEKLTPNDPAKTLVEIAKSEQHIDDMTMEFRDHQVSRMKEGICMPEVSIIYSEMLTDFERIGDHMLNIAEAYASMKSIEA